MAMKGSSVRGTPVRHISNTRHEGIAPGRPKGMEGTVHKDYASDHRGYQKDPRSGTPYNSEAGNSDEFSREVSHDERGHITDHVGQVNNDPKSNGNGVVFDGVHPQNYYEPRGHGMMDSPVPADAPVFDTGFINEENRAHAGRSGEGTSRDKLLEIGGVMSRGMDTVSQAGNKDEDELVHDDILNKAIGRKDI